MNNNNNNNEDDFRSILDNNFITDIYESFVNDIISIPLTNQQNYQQNHQQNNNIQRYITQYLYRNNNQINDLDINEYYGHRRSNEHRHRRSENRSDIRGRSNLNERARNEYIRARRNNEEYDRYDNYGYRHNINNINNINSDINSAMRLNSRIIYNIYNIRRQLELQNPRRYETFYPMTHSERRRSNRIDGYFSGLHDMRIVNNDFIDSIQNLFDNIIDQYNDTFEDVKVTLTNEQFSKLKIQTIDDNMLKEYENKDCNICIESYKKDDKITILPCNHIFHDTCIENWLCNEKVTCPICRTDIREYLDNNENTVNTVE
jgi:hypothetical protein